MAVQRAGWPAHRLPVAPAGQRHFAEASRHITPRANGTAAGGCHLSVGELAGKTAREQLQRALFWQGFGMLGSDYFAPQRRPDQRFDALIADGLGELAGSSR